MKAAIVVIIILVIAFPLLVQLIPEPLTIDSFTENLTQSGYKISEPVPVEPPQRESAEEWILKTGAGEQFRVELYRYDNGAKLTTNYEYLKPDAGTAIVQSTNIASELGAATPSNFDAVGKRGKWVIHVMGPDKGMCESIVRAAAGK